VTEDEHRQRIRDVVDLVRSLHGKEGLLVVGLQYRNEVIIDKHEKVTEATTTATVAETTLPEIIEETAQEALGAEDPAFGAEEEASSSKPATTTTTTTVDLENEAPTSKQEPCAEEAGHTTTTRLFHTESNTMVNEKNRKEFIADGDMYEVVARLCQEVAQETMIKDGNLEWVTICDAGNNPEPIRALVSSGFSLDVSARPARPTLLIATGKGKVRAGIFSRQHLIVSGMECSTAIPIVREAFQREMNVVMLDPNVHGDRLGMITFEKSMARIFGLWEQDEASDDNPATATADSSLYNPPLTSQDLFVLSHSQSGAQLARYLLEKSKHYLPHIRAVAFTDSTHNIQWARANEDLHNLLQSPNCVYFKSSKEETYSYNNTTTSQGLLEPLQTVGEEIQTDSFWQHRFGKITTRCAGTSEHSLTNWFAQTQIWDHFDSHLHNMPTSTGMSTGTSTSTSTGTSIPHRRTSRHELAEPHTI
jgi:hypothetical protein